MNEPDDLNFHRAIIYSGCMFSGKSTELIKVAKHLIALGINVHAIKYIHDKRYEHGKTEIVSHNGDTLDAIATGKLCDQLPLKQEIDVVCIDEGQMFPDLIEFVKRANKTIVIAGLDLTYKKEPFGQMIELMKLVGPRNVTKLTAKCACGKRAEYTKRTIPGDKLIMIGGAEMYKPTCEACFSS